MKQFKFLTILCAGVSALLVTSCKNQEVDFPNFDYTTTYFAYQYPVRTIVLGEDTYDTSLDNLHQCKIYATMGGVYANNKLINIDFVVDNTLCNNLYFSAGGPAVQAMPANYYTLGSNKIALDHDLQGAVDVQLTDAFFADNNALQNTYVIPLRMTNVANADSILSGVPKVANAPKCNSALWDILPKDYVLYCVKFINPWQANYLRRGKDNVSVGTTNTTKVRHNQYVENDEVVNLSTQSLSSVQFPVSGHKNFLGTELGLKVKINFTQDQKCTISPAYTASQVNDSVRVYNIVATGNGEFIKKGEKNSWGNKDRNALYLGYQLVYEVETTYPKLHLPTVVNKYTVNTTDTLVVRDRGVKMETFTPSYK